MAAELKISPEALGQALSVSHQTKSTVRERVMRKLIWFRHLGVYGASMAALTGFDLLPDGNIDWVPYPILGWGIALGAHAVVAFSGKGSRLERRLMQREEAQA